MVQQTQLRLLFKYIEENMDTAVSSYDAKQIKKILGGILLDEPVRIPELEQPAKPFDRERFEAMFRAVIETHEATINALKQLDAYYETKEGGNNG